MRNPLLSIITLIILNANVTAIEIQFDGHPPHNSNFIIEKLKSEPNPTFEILDSFTKLLIDNGYLDAAIVIADGRLIVSAGRRYILSQIVFVEDTTFAVTINQPFDSVNTARAIESRFQHLRDSGFYYVTGRTERIKLQDTAVVLTVAVNKGPQVKFGEPLLSGLTRTDSKIVKKYLPPNQGGILTASYINDVNRAAEQIPFVRFKPPIVLQPRPGYTISDIVLNFMEKTPVRFEGAVGISGGQDNSPVWSFNLTLNNLFGQGKRARIKSERPDSRRNLLDINYSQPLDLIGLGELNLGVRTRDYRDEFYDFAIVAGYRARLNRNFLTGFDFEWKSSKPRTGNAGYNRYSGEFSLSRQTYTDNFNPAKGLLLEWGINFSFRKYTAEILPPNISRRSINETRNRLGLKLFQPIAGPFQLHSILKYAGLETSESLPPLSELILIGGPGTIRGYRTEQFSVVRAAMSAFETRVRYQEGFIFAFYDAAYLNNRELDSDGRVITNEQFKWSYGLGFGLGNDRRSVLISLGINPELGLGDPRLAIELLSDI